MLTRTEGEPIQLFPPDVPPGELEGDADAFGHLDYATAVASVLKDAESPFTLGLFGQWGMGKTTIIEEIERQLSEVSAYAYFDVWRYEGDALRRQFLRDVARQLSDRGEIPGFKPDRDLADFVEDRHEIRERFAPSWRRAVEALITSAIGLLAVFLLLRLRATGSFFSGKGVGKDAVTSALVAAALFFATPFTRVLRVVEDTVTRTRLEDPELFTDRFQKMLTHLRRDRLVIAIDNLDRCSPERVEELLSTIKTYLEPSVEAAAKRRLQIGKLKKKHVLFVVAADDEALRRHLEEREATGSADPSKIREYVDEYLRKFFSASIRIKPILDEDMGTYVAKQLEPFMQRHRVAVDAQRRVVEIVSAALRRNPRRVKEFAKNLETRMRLIKQREDEERIVPPIHPNIEMIMKLAILEEQWPLPRYLEFEQAITSGGLETAEEILAEAPGKVEGYASRLRQILNREIESGFFEGALSVVEAACVIPHLVANEDALRTVLARAVEEPTVRNQLNGLPARAVLRASRLLPEAERRLLIEPFVNLTYLFGQSPSRAADVARALGEPEIIRLIDDSAKARLTQELEAEPLRSQFDVIAPLAEAEPALLPATAGAVAAQGLSTDFNTEAGPFRVVRAWLRRQGDQLDVPQQMLQATAGHLSALFAGVQAGSEVGAKAVGEPARKMLSDVTQVVGLFRGVPVDAVTQFSAQINESVISGWPEDSRAELLDLWAAVASITAPQASAQAQNLIDHLFTTHREFALRYVASRGESLSPIFKGHSLAQLSSLAGPSYPEELQLRASDAILQLVPDDAGGYLAQAIASNIASRQLDAVRGQFTRYRQANGPKLEEFLQQILDLLVELVPPELFAALGILADFAGEMSDSQRDAYRAFLQEQLVSVDAERAQNAAEYAERAAKDSSFAAELRPMVRGVFEQLKVQDPPQIAAVAFVVQHFDVLDEVEQDGLLTRASEWIRSHSALRSPIATVLNLLPRLPAKRISDLVSSLMIGETLEPEASVTVRVDLLRLARSIAPATSRVARQLKERLETLRAGSPSDQQVFESVTAD
jgi:KAP family P-loop domain